MNLPMNQCYPEDAQGALMLGRVWQGGAVGGPCVVMIEDQNVYDITSSFPLMSELLNQPDLQNSLAQAQKELIGEVFPILENSDAATRNPEAPYFLAPCDLQVIKACGVTFASSMLERLVEEQAKGDPAKAQQFRESLESEIQVDLGQIQLGSAEAAQVKEALLKKTYGLLIWRWALVRMRKCSPKLLPCRPLALAKPWEFVRILPGTIRNRKSSW